MRPKLLLTQELDGVRGHQRQVQLHRQPRRGPRAALGLGRAVALHLQIEGIRERRGPVLRRLDRPGMVARQQELAHLAATGPRQRDQPARRLCRQPFGQQREDHRRVQVRGVVGDEDEGALQAVDVLLA